MDKSHRRALLFLVPLALCISACAYWLFLWSPVATWDHSPDKIVFYASHIGEVTYGEIPRVQVWGDGHIVWVTYTEDEYRQVWEGYFSENQMEDLIDQFIRAGFFKPYRRLFKQNYIYDYIAVYLSDANHDEMIDPENYRIYELVEYLTNGAGINGNPFIPTTGQLFAFPIEKTEFHEMDVNTPYTWPDEGFGYTLESISADGYPIEDNQINYVWEIVNSPTPFVVSEGKIYWIAFVIPGVSY